MSSAAKRTILYGVLALCLMGFCYVQGRASATDDLTLDRASALLGGHGAYQRAIGLLRDSEAAFVRSEGFWRAKADSLGRRFHAANPVGVQPSSHLDSAALASRLPSRSSTDSGVPYQPADSLRVIFLGRALDACDASRAAADSALARCGRRADSLETSLREVLAVKECRFLFFKCPSRSAFFLLGAVGGALLKSRLAK